MEERLWKLEASQAVIAEKLEGFRANSIQRMDSIQRKIDKLPTEWAMARIVFFVVGSLMAAAIWGPRAISIFQDLPK